MLFNSYGFIFIFLPIVFTVYFILNKLQLIKWALLFLVAASLFFYSYWNINYLPLILFSVFFNYSIGSLLHKKPLKWILGLGIAVNLSLLGYFKYAQFLTSNLDYFLGTNIALASIILPLAISFFTFQQIAFLVDSYKGTRQGHAFLEYVLFVTFFPQLIAGPIVQHNEMMPQFKSIHHKKINSRNIVLGLFIFFMGLFKKVVIADSLAVWATRGFDHQASLTFIEGWITLLSYTFQLYFDFSGYTDMAIGAALLFNIHLPVNFNSPYKAVNIKDFWNRWHITLGRFLGKYVYIPLGGNQNGKAQTYINLMIVFIISGFWHGAGWTFIFWGFLHGVAMVIHRIWTSLHIKMHRYVAWFITFQFVNVSWIFFRATTWGDALKVLQSMFSVDPLILSTIYSYKEIITGLMIVLVIVLFTQNSLQRTEPFKASWITALFISFLAVFAVLSLDKVSEFLYFNF